MAFEDCQIASTTLWAKERFLFAQWFKHGVNADDKLSRIRAFRILHGRGGPVAAANSSKCCCFEAVGDARNILHLN